jgi:oxaloacetate decarboxylase beta subunit
MIDFGPMLANPSVLIFGAAGQFGIFLTLLLALGLGFPFFLSMILGGGQ